MEGEATQENSGLETGQQRVVLTSDGCRWWENKGDVWRLLQDMAVTIDGRTFPAKDEAQVHWLHHAELQDVLLAWAVYSEWTSYAPMRMLLLHLCDEDPAFPASNKSWIFFPPNPQNQPDVELHVLVVQLLLNAKRRAISVPLWCLSLHGRCHVA